MRPPINRQPAALSIMFLVTLMITSNLAAQSKTSPLGPVGTVWGGTHVELEIAADGATLEFDCATGTLSLPLKLDSKGNFTAKGTYLREHGGPVMRDESHVAAAATYSGVLVGDTLHLKVNAGAASEGMPDLTLTRGQSGRVMKCK